MPDWKKIVEERIAPLHLEGAAEANLTNELADHLEDCFREHCSAGASELEAKGKAMAELDGLYPPQMQFETLAHEPKQDAVPPGDAHMGTLMADFWRDLRYCLRSMRQSPLFVMFVVLTLALGIGANTTVFTLINTLILNPLPVPNSSELVAVGASKAGSNTKPVLPLPLSYADLQDYQSRNQSFRSLAGYTSPRSVSWQSGNSSQPLFCELVTANYFSTLGIDASHGRFFAPEEDSAPGAHPVAVLNFGTWQQRFGGANDIVGKTVQLNRIVFTVVGVAPPAFIGVNGMFGPDFWIPAAMGELLFPTDMRNIFSDRGKALFAGIGRLQPGVTLKQAQADLGNLAADLAREYQATDEGRSADARPVREVLFASASTGSTSILFASVGLLAVVGIVLLIACSNVANLLLARAAARTQEMAVRLALGASRPRLIRQLLTESVLLGILSGCAGLFLAYAALHLLFGALPASANFIRPKLDMIVFLFAFLISVATGLLFGTIPALRASRASVAEALKQETRTAGRSRHKVSLGNTLLVGQIAFSFLLLMTAILFLRSIGRAYSIDPGFQTAHLATLIASPGQAGYSRAQAKAFYKNGRERVASLAGIESASWASNMPLWARAANGLEIEGRDQRSKADQIAAVVNTVDIEYFETAGIRVDRGREFSSHDHETATPVAVVNEKLARDYWPKGDALGKRVRIPGETQWRQIVGIARNANYTAWAEPPQLCVYVPLEQKFSDQMTMYIRSKGDPQQMLQPVEHELQAAAPGPLSIAFVRTGKAIVDGGLFQVKMGVVLLSVFGMLALGLASVGLYGIMAYSVAQRKREIGLRMALGAARASVVTLMLRQGMSLVLTGVLIGFTAALPVTHLLGKMLYGIGGNDPISFGGAALVLLAIALLACYLPARWASRVDPLVALRES